MQCMSMEQAREWRRENVSRRAWKRQITCVTPDERLPWFTAELVRQFGPFDHALVVADLVISDDPPALQALRRAAGETRPVLQAPGHVLDEDPEQFRRVLELMFFGSMDFRVLFSPSTHALRTDHDGYTTIFSTSTGWMARLKQVLREANVDIVRDHTAAAP